MRKSLWQLVLTITALCCTSTLSAAQGPRSSEPATQFASVRGVITDTAGRPIADAIVELSNSGQYSLIRLRTSASGEFSTDSLIAGDNYTVAVTRLGYRATESKPFRANADNQQVVNLILKPRETVTLRAEARTVLAAKSDSARVRAQAK